MSNIYDYMETMRKIQEIVTPLQPLLEQTRQIRQYGMDEINIANSLGFPQTTKLLHQGAFNDLNAINIYNKGILVALQAPILTKEMQALQKGILGNQSLAVNEYVQQVKTNWESIMGLTDIVQRSFSAQNIAMLKLIPDYQKYDLPYGAKTVIRNLSINAAMKMAQTDDILFDTDDRSFYHEDNPEVKVTAKEITVMDSSIELFADITLTELIQFESQLYENPIFAIEHPVGKRIYEIIRNWSDFIDFDCTAYYHARSLKGNPYLEQEMMKAPMNVSAHGRYNEIGKSCYYFTDQKEGALNEIRKHSGGTKPTIQVAVIKPVKSIRMIDLSQKVLSKKNNFIDHIRFAVDTGKGAVIKEYLLPNFVAYCCKKVGIEGIKYYGNGYNCYVTWRDDYFEFVEHEIVEPQVGK